MSLELYYSLVATSIVSLISLIGILFLGASNQLLKKYLLLFVSFSTGALFGDVFLHILPELSKSGFSVESGLGVMGGIIIFFMLEKVIFWHHCHIPTANDHPHPLVWTNIIGDGLHNFIDGVMIATSFLISPSIGIATTLAVVMHEIPQEIGDFSILIHGGLSVPKAIWFNLLSALLAIIGAVVVLILGNSNALNINLLLSTTAGGFIYLAGSDLIPELKKETRLKVSILQLIAIVIGILIMYGLVFVK